MSEWQLVLRMLITTLGMLLGIIAMWREEYPKAAAYFAFVAAERSL